jgi:GH15 family glucan-1,4-alpha-glucosidase
LPQRQFVSGKVMSFVTLDRALQIAAQTGQTGPFLGDWEAQRARIFADVMSRGWSEALGAFRQHYDGDSLDAAALLIPIMNLLPPQHPRVTQTIARLSESLEINRFLHRFDDSGSDGPLPGVLGDHEGAFLMCSFWLAQVLAQRGDIGRAEAILGRAEAIAGDLGLYAEAVDARASAFLGNTPLVFSQVEYARAAIAVEKAKTSAEGKAEAAMPAGASLRHELS